MPPPATDLPYPPEVPDHELFRRIGSGSYGEVWLARNLATGALRAGKIVYRRSFEDARPFNREFEGIKKFDAISRSHPSQLALFHVGRNDAAGYFYYVMELADPIPVGDDVKRLTLTEHTPAQPKVPSGAASGAETHVVSYIAHTLRVDLEHGRLATRRVLEIALALTEALAHLHAHGLVHRDVKPSNIIYVGGVPKLADIGLVTDASDSRSIVGTEGYLPREGPGTPGADIYALGKVLYEVLTGMDRREYPELPSDLRQWPDAPLAFELNTIIVKGCAADIGERYSTANEMLGDLKLLRTGRSIKRRRAWQRGWDFTWKAAALLSIIAGVVWQTRRPDSRSEASAPAAVPPATKRSTTNEAAWQAHQRASQMAMTYTPRALSNAVQEFERAISLDPNFTGAWSTLSICLSIAVENGYLAASNALPRAKLCAETAIRLDPKAGYPYVALAWATLPLDYDFAEAELLYRKAIALDSKNWTLRMNFAYHLTYYSRFEEAERWLKQLTAEEPNQGNPHAALGFLYSATRRFPEAISEYNDSLRLEPDRPLHHLNRGDLHWAMNQHAAAAQDWLRFVELSGFVSLNPILDGSALRQHLDEGGPAEFLKQLIALLQERLIAGHVVSSFDLARLHAQAGHRETALDYLEKAVDEHRGIVLSANVLLAFQEIRDDPHFRAVLRRLNLQK